MVNSGKHKDNKMKTNKEIGQDVMNFVLPSQIEMIRMGLGGLADIHRHTNLMVKQGENVLSDVLATDDVLRTYVLAIMVELGEFVQTLDWKPWRKNPRAISRESTLDEMADILAFMGVLLTILQARGYSIKEVTNAYENKIHTNVNRFLDAQ